MKYIPKFTRQYLTEAYETMSLGQIAKANDTYTLAIKRAFDFYGIPIKDKSESQKLALERGTALHPKKRKKDDVDEQK